MFSNKNGIKNQIKISACIYLGQALTGYTISWMGPTVNKLNDLESSPLPHTLSQTQIALIASFIYFGAIPGPYLMGWLSNLKGRKPCLIIGGTTVVVAYTILALSKSLAMLFIGRFLCGIGIGIIGMMNVVYIGEIASTSIRGILLTVMGIFTTAGSILVFSIGPFYSYLVSTYVGLILAVAFTLFTFMIPESPMFYVLQNDEISLARILKTLGRLNDKDYIYEEEKEIKSISAKKDWSELFTVKANREGLFVVVAINVLQQASGIMTFIFYSGSIFQKAGLSLSSSVRLIIMGCFQLVGSFIAPIVIEKLGRKILLLVSTALCSISMLTLGVYFYFDYTLENGVTSVKWLPMVLLILFYVGYHAGLGIVPNVLVGEMFTINVRSKGAAVTLSIAWVAGFLVTTAFGSMVMNFGAYGTFWFFSCTSVCAFLFSLFCVPETKGKSLLEIQKLLNDNYL